MAQANRAGAQIYRIPASSAPVIHVADTVARCTAGVDLEGQALKMHLLPRNIELIGRRAADAQVHGLQPGVEPATPTAGSIPWRCVDQMRPQDTGGQLECPVYYVC